ncbi:hypothetical protein ACVWW7_004035 [Bradyrhizobium sp. LM6.9]
MIDADQHEGRGRPETGRLLDRLGQRRDQMRAIELAGQRIEPGQLRQFLVAGVALIVDADGADRAHRPTIGSREPAAGLFDPDHGIGSAHAHTVLDPVGRAVGAVHGGGLRQRSGPQRLSGLDQLGEFGAGGQPLGGNSGGRWR